MNITTARNYLNPIHQAETLMLLGDYEAHPTDDERSAVEELLFELMEQYPECVCKPFVTQYHRIRLAQIEAQGDVEE